MPDNRPIGFMDSGLGGVSVLREAVELMPRESFIFFGDNANAPYGNKSREEICRFAFAVAEALVKDGVKALVIACNTATSAAIDDIRASFDIPVISMEPAIKPALEQTEGKILMLATPMTCSLSRYHKLKDRLDVSGRVEDVPCLQWVECIETHLTERERCQEPIENALKAYDGQHIGGIVLGCTHFSLVAEQVACYAREHFRGKPRIFDGSVGTVKHLVDVLSERDALADCDARQAVKLMSSGGDEYTDAMRAILVERGEYTV